MLRAVVAVGVSLLVQKRNQGGEQSAGLQTSQTTVGGTDPQGTIIGLYATGGHLVYRNSHGANNRYLTHVIELSDISGISLERLIIDGEYSTIGTEEHPDFGFAIEIKTTDGVDRAWLRFIDGTHTAADPYLVAQYGDDEDRPWTSGHILTGVAHVILTFDFLERAFKAGVPDLQFELGGIALYDPRADSSVGGVGSQRWDDPDTWARSTNPIVQTYHIMRGLTLPCGGIWGGKAEAEDLPLDSWIAAMNVCDLQVGDPLRTQYQAGYEIRFQDQPVDVVKELLAAANAQICELGGVWTVQVGAPAPAGVHITDDDILVSDPQQFDPFPGLETTYNAISAAYPSPEALWQAAPVDIIINADWEAEDGRQRLFELKLPTVPWAEQAAQVANNLLRDNRRFRSHAHTLPPEYFGLSPLHTLTWSSEWNSYDTKSFEISEVAYDLRTMRTAVSLRERDPNDFTFMPDLDLPDAPRVLVPVIEIDAGVPGFGVTGIVLTDGNDTPRRPGIRAIWNTSIADTVDGLAFELRIAGQTELSWSGTTAQVSAGQITLGSVLPDTDYEMRPRPVSSARATSWGAWFPVTTPNVLLGSAELSQEVWDAIAEDADAIAEGLLDDIVPIMIAAYDVETVQPIAVQIPPLLADITRLDREIELREIDQQNADDALAQANEHILWLLSSASGTASLVRDAGIYVDPDDGEVRIAAVDGISDLLGTRMSEVEVLVDAQNASIELKATYGYVNQVVSDALLDPSQIPVVEDLQLRITTAEIDIDALEGSIALKVDTTTFTGLDGRVTTAEADLDSLNDALALKVETTVFAAAETRLTSAEQTLSTLDGAQIAQTVIDTRNAHEALDEASVTDLQALLTAYEGRDAIRTDLAYATQDMRALVDEDRVALAAINQSLGAAVADSVALIETEQSVRADSDSALAQSIIDLQVTLGTAEAAITELNTVSVESTSPTALAVYQLVLDVTDVIDETAVQALAISQLDTFVTGLNGTLTTQSRRYDQLVVAVGGDQMDQDEATLQAVLDQFETRSAARTATAIAAEDLRALILEDREAQAVLETSLGASIAGNVALIKQEKLARADADNALAQSIETLSATAADQSAAITEINQVSADSDSPTARAVYQLQLDVTATAGDLVANVQAISELDTRIDTAEDALTVQADAITQLVSDLSDADSDFLINASALTALTTRVSDTENDLSTQSDAITQLISDLAGADGDILTNANALTALTTRVTSAETGLTSQASSITQLTTTQGAHSATLTQHASSLDGLELEYVLQLDNNGHVSGMVLRSELGDSGAAISTAAFIADKFAIVGPGASPDAPFVVYTSSQVIDGLTIPAGTYITDAMIRDGVINRARITDTLESDNYAESGGIPTQGIKIDFKNDQIKVAGAVFSRNIVAATGSFDVAPVTINPSLDLHEVASWDLVETGVQVPVNQVWMASEKTYLVYAAFSGAATATGGISGTEEFWGCIATVQPFARWNGPQQLYLHIELWAKGITKLHAAGNETLPGTIHWTLYEVT